MDNAGKRNLIRDSASERQVKEGRARLGALPLDPIDEDSWNKHLASLTDDVILSIRKSVTTT